MKKLLFLLFVASTTLSYAEIYNGTCGDNLTWSLNTEDSTLVIEGSGAMNDWINNDSWLDYSSYVVHVFLPDELTSIGYMAFYNCSSLVTISIPQSVTIIENYAFSHCTSLSSITIPENVSIIRYEAFSYCTSLNSISIPNSVIEIGDQVFHDNTSLSYISLSNNIREIGYYTFANCSSLKTITIPDSVVTIGESAFLNCSSLEYVSIPYNLSEIGAKVFSGCTSLSSILWNSKNYPDFNEYETPFRSYKNNYDIRYQITSFVFGKKVENIPAYICSGMQNINSVIIPDGVTSIGNSAFISCNQISALTIPNSVKEIGESAFQYCSMHSLIIGNNVSTIGNYAFDHCGGIVSVLIPQSVTSIGWRAFDYCTSLESIYMESEVPPTIDEMAFYKNLQSIFVPCGYLDTYRTTDGWNEYVAKIKNLPLPYTVEGIVLDNIGGSVQVPTSICEDITAVPDYGYHFVKWSDGNTDNPRTIELTQDTIFIAEFTTNKYVVSGVCENTQGKILGLGEYDYLSTPAIEVVPYYGYHFTQWSDGNTDNPRIITLAKDTTFTAELAYNRYSLDGECDNTKGQITGLGEYDYLSTPTIEVVPNYGYHFSQWSDGNTDNPRIITLTQDTTFTAEFAINQYYLSVTCDAEYGFIEGESGYFNYRTQHKYKVVPNYGYCFDHWSDGNSSNPRTIRITRDSIISAVFVPAVFSVSGVCDPEQGSVSGMSSDYLSNTTVTATPKYGYHFVQWSDGNTDNPRSFIITQDTIFTAEFAPNRYKFTKFVEDENGNIEGAENGEYNYKESLLLTAVPSYGYTFFSWWEYSCAASVVENAISVAEAERIASALPSGEKTSQQYTIIGYVRSKYNSYSNSYYMSDNNSTTSSFVVFKATRSASIGDRVIVTGYLTNYQGRVPETTQGATLQKIEPYADNPCSITIKGETTISASFQLAKYIVTDASDSQKGHINGTGKFTYMSEIQIEAISNYGYHFTRWSDGNMDNPRSLIITQDTTFTAEFSVNKSGTCGADNLLNWEFDDQSKILTISGKGTLDDNYTYGLEAPTQMRKLILGDEISVIGESAFYGSNRLMRIYLGASVETIGDNAFRNCPYILEIHAPMEFPPIIDASVFAECGDLGGIDCYVPEESLALYKKTNVWKEFNLMVATEPTPTGIDIVTGDPSSATHKILRDGQIFILRGDKTYTVTGQEIR